MSNWLFTKGKAKGDGNLEMEAALASVVLRIPSRRQHPVRLVAKIKPATNQSGAFSFLV